jgi:hypothetical protein
VDGFTHATADPSKLLGVANHFYKSVKSDWLCLKMTRSTLAAAGITVKVARRAASPVTPAADRSLFAAGLSGNIESYTILFCLCS